jgi:NADP-dependent 3-hydroxy acid dehydrogenase YdfG
MEPELRKAGAPGVRLLALDVRDGDAVAQAIDGLPDEWKTIEVLVNNAGLSRGLDKLHEGLRDDWDEMIDTNVKGVLYVDRAVVPLLVARGRGTVIHLGSIAGRQLYPGGNVYCASKHAVRALNEGLRLDLLGTGVRVATVDPGMVAETDFSLVRFHGDAERAAAVYRGLTPLTPEDVAEVIVYIASRPPHVNVAETVILPTDQASATNVHRRGDAR